MVDSARGQISKGVRIQVSAYLIEGFDINPIRPRESKVLRTPIEIFSRTKNEDEDEDENEYDSSQVPAGTACDELSRVEADPPLVVC